MTREEFNDLTKMRLDKCLEILGKKASVYASDVDRLRNFKVAARKLNTIPEVALRGMRIKHEVAIDDFIDALTEGITGWISIDEWEEKIGDSINYLLLLYALVVERYDEAFNEYCPEDDRPNSRI